MVRWLLVALLVHSVYLTAQAASVQVRIKAQSTVVGPRVTLGEIAELESENPALLNQLKSIPIAYISQPGYSVNLYPGIVFAKLKVAGFDPRQIAFQAPSHVVVSTACRRISSDQLIDSAVAFLREHYLASETQIEIRPVQTPPPLTVTPGPLQLKPHVEGTIPEFGFLTVTIDVMRDQKRLQRVRMPLEVRRYREVWQTKQPLRSGQSLQPSVIERVSLDMRQIRGKPWFPERQVEDYRVRQDIPAGRILTEQSVERIPLIERGDAIQVEVQISGVYLRLSAKALNSAGYGEIIELMNPSSGKRIQARAVSKKRARIVLE